MWHKCNGKAVQYGASLIDSEQENLIVTALWNDRSGWELVTFNCKGTEINDTEVFDKLNHIQFLRPAVVCAYALFPAPLSWHTTLINLALRNPFWLHLRSTATPVCQSFIGQAPDSFPTHLIKVTIAEPALLTFAFSSSVWMGLLFSFLSANQPVLFGNVCIPPIKQGGAWWLLIRSSVGPEQHSWGCAGSLLERNAAENKSRESDSPNPKKQYFFFF